MNLVLSVFKTRNEMVFLRLRLPNVFFPQRVIYLESKSCGCLKPKICIKLCYNKEIMTLSHM